jgi:nitrogen fixation NifU-like protein
VGCSISQASASVMTELVQGRPVGEGLRVADEFKRVLRGEIEPDEDVLGDLIAFQGVAKYPLRVKCALLGWMAFTDAAARASSGGQARGETVYGEEQDENAVRSAKAAREEAPGGDR